MASKRKRKSQVAGKSNGAPVAKARLVEQLDRLSGLVAAVEAALTGDEFEETPARFGMSMMLDEVRSELERLQGVVPNIEVEGRAPYQSA
jgi:hypothetical protein